MRQTIDKILLFTLSACPMGRSMKTVLEEWLASENEYGITFDVIYVDVDPETTNRYRIKENPTTIFVNDDSMELYRIEGFKEIEDVRRLTTQLKKGLLRTEIPQEANRMSAETYTIFLYRNDIAVPIETNVINKTSIKAPRITVIQQLLASRPEGFSNPFPVDCSLERVSFDRDVCLVTLSSKMETEAEERERMKLLLVYTMKAYGISEVQIYWAESHKKSDS